MNFTRKFVTVTFLIILYDLVFILLKNVWIFEKISEKSILFREENISWENTTWIEYEKSRRGPGEQGLAYHESDPKLRKKNEHWRETEGFYVEVSNKISLTRALPDFRLPICSQITYPSNLPNVSVIITFYNEFTSTLLRCLHSVYNRSPRSLLHEIILVNDNSTFPQLYENLRNYVKDNFGDTVKIHETKERQGLIKARMTGAEMATGEVLVFLDSHMEVFNSWLPPLLEPLVRHPTYATIPICDGINPKTFRPEDTGNGYRGMFDWNLRFQWVPLRPEDKLRGEGQPHETPCLTGGHYAIRRDHFFHLGGYDEGLKIWNGENYDLCLKLWLCSGGIFEVPCSRIAHLSKMNGVSYEADVVNYSDKNLKRVVEIWFDDHKKYFFERDPEYYRQLDHGNISKQLQKKSELNCKPFSYYLDVVAPDMLLRFPAPKKYFADGKISSNADSRCLGLPNDLYDEPVALVDCNSSTTKNKWTLTLERSIRLDDINDVCLDSDTMTLNNCHHSFANQYWKFDSKTRFVTNSEDMCMTANSSTGAIFLADCESLDTQKWSWTSENHTALDNWETEGIIMTYT